MAVLTKQYFNVFKRYKKNVPMSKGVSMKVTIDYDRCMGDGHCSEVCPEVFNYDEEKTEVSVTDEVVPEQYQSQVRRAADECGTGAIVIEE